MKNTILYSADRFDYSVASSLSTRGQCDCNCDCACGIALPAFSGKLSASTFWHTSKLLMFFPLSPQHRLIVYPSGHNPIVLDLNGCAVLDSFSSPRPIDSAFHNEETVVTARQLAELGLLTPDDDDRADPSGKHSFDWAGKGSPVLTAWLHLTDQCNLRCSYCYLPHVNEEMSLETGRGVIDAIFRSAVVNNFDQIKIKYAGGEPLLRYRLILELSAYARSLADKHDVVLGEVVLSNGTLLTHEIASTFKSLEIGLMISLDGYGAYHDSHRAYANGRGSFEDTAESVEIARANGLVPGISVTVSSRTAAGLPEIIMWILERDLPFGLNFYRENEYSSGHKDMRLDEQKIIDGMIETFKVIENNLPRKGFLGGIIDRANLSSAHTHTCGVGKNYLVFDPRGKVAKCQMSLHQPITDHHVADLLAVLRADRLGLQNISVEEKEDCKTCEWKYWCAGGCPLATHRATGRYDVKSPNCNIYKTLYPEALRLEGLRLLKYQDDPEVVVRY